MICYKNHTSQPPRAHCPPSAIQDTDLLCCCSKTWPRSLRHSEPWHPALHCPALRHRPHATPVRDDSDCTARPPAARTFSGSPLLSDHGCFVWEERAGRSSDPGFNRVKSARRCHRTDCGMRAVRNVGLNRPALAGPHHQWGQSAWNGSASVAAVVHTSSAGLGGSKMDATGAGGDGNGARDLRTCCPPPPPQMGSSPWFLAGAVYSPTLFQGHAYSLK